MGELTIQLNSHLPKIFDVEITREAIFHYNGKS